MGISVSDALKIGVFSQGQIQAGKRNLGNIIERIEVIESPYQPEWQAKNYLYLTAFYAMVNDSPGQTRTVEMLFANGCSGLCFQSFHFSELDPAVIQRAEDLGLPLIQIPATLTFSEIIMALAGAILDEKSYQLMLAEEANRKLKKLISDGGGLQAIATALYQLLTRPIAIIDNYGSILADYSFESNKPDLPDAILAVSQSNLNQQLKPFRLSPYNLWFSPVNNESMQVADAFMVIYDLDAKLDKSDMIVVEQAASLVALELASIKLVWETERRLMKDVIDDLLGGNYDSVDAIMARARTFGWNLFNKKIIVLIDLNFIEQNKFIQKIKSEENNQLIRNHLFQIFTQIINGNNPESIIIDQCEHVVLLLDYEEGAQFSDVREDIGTLTESIQSHTSKYLNGFKIPIAIGGFYETVEGLCQSYKDAKLCLNMLHKIDSQKNIIWYEDAIIYLILDSFISLPKVRQWLEKTLGSLLEYDQKNNTELLKTLETYFDTNQKLQQTAHKLFIHPKTLKYRLQRIEEIVGRDPFLGEKQFNYYLATKLARFLSPITRNKYLF